MTWMLRNSTSVMLAEGDGFPARAADVHQGKSIDGFTGDLGGIHQRPTIDLYAFETVIFRGRNSLVTRHRFGILDAAVQKIDAEKTAGRGGHVQIASPKCPR